MGGASRPSAADTAPKSRPSLGSAPGEFGSGGPIAGAYPWGIETGTEKA